MNYSMWLARTYCADGDQKTWQKILEGAVAVRAPDFLLQIQDRNQCVARKRWRSGRPPDHQIRGRECKLGRRRLRRDRLGAATAAPCVKIGFSRAGGGNRVRERHVPPLECGVESPACQCAKQRRQAQPGHKHCRSRIPGKSKNMRGTEPPIPSRLSWRDCYAG